LQQYRPLLQLVNTPPQSSSTIHTKGFNTPPMPTLTFYHTTTSAPVSLAGVNPPTMPRPRVFSRPSNTRGSISKNTSP